MPRPRKTEEEKKEARREYMREYQRKRYNSDESYRKKQLKKVRNNIRRKKLI